MSWVIRAFLGNTQKPRVSLGIVRGRPEQKKCEGKLSVESRVWKTRGVLPYKGLRCLHCLLAFDATTCCESQNMKPSPFFTCHVRCEMEYDAIDTLAVALSTARGSLGR